MTQTQEQTLIALNLIKMETILDSIKTARSCAGLPDDVLADLHHDVARIVEQLKFNSET